MKWSWKIGRLAGIDVFIHATFLLLVGFVGISYWQQTKTVAGTLEGIGFLLALFASVVLHEFGHALTARRYGIKTRDITLLPIGGVARLERMPDKPVQEFWVALAGPAVNVLIGILLFAYLTITKAFVPLNGISMTGGPFLERLMSVNISLVLFNLLPAFPMDGGRVLRSALAMRMDYTRATHIAASIGQGMAFLFGLVGLFINPFLVFIALFVWIGAQQEASLAQMKSALGGIPVQRAMLTEYHTVSPHHNLAQVIQLILEGSQHDFPVVDEGRVVGVLTRRDLMTTLSQRDRSTLVAEVMRRDFDTVNANDMLEPAFARLQACNCSLFPVLQNGQLVGLLTTDNIGEFLMIQAVLEKRDIKKRTI